MGRIEFSATKLTKWRRLLILREIRINEYGYRTSFCPLCGNDFSPWALQAHHIRPKSLYPELAYELRNGIMLCLSCHMGLIHRNSSFNDMVKKVYHWKFFVPSFDRYVNAARQRRFNEANQHRVESRRRRRRR